MYAVEMYTRGEPGNYIIRVDKENKKEAIETAKDFVSKYG